MIFPPEKMCSYKRLGQLWQIIDPEEIGSRYFSNKHSPDDFGGTFGRALAAIRPEQLGLHCPQAVQHLCPRWPVWHDLAHFSDDSLRREVMLHQLWNNLL